MLSNDGYFLIRHDTGLLAVAVGLCLLAALVLVNLVAHAAAARGLGRVAWLAIAGVTGGTGIWATHFFAMQGFITGLRTGFDPVLMVVALVSAVVSTTLGLAVATAPGRRWRAVAGGALLGGGIALMHGVGMAAYEVAGAIERDPRFMVLAAACGTVLAATAFGIGQDGRVGRRLACALLLAAAICAQHFIALAAVSIGMEPGVFIPADALAAADLMRPVSIANGAILLLALVALLADLRARRSAAAERRRMTSLAEAAVEGLMICDGDIVVTVNTSFALLSGFPAAEIAGTKLAALLPECSGRDAWPRRGAAPVETVLLARSGEAVPVEVLVNDVHFAGKLHQVIALRDLGARKRAEESIRFLAHHDALTGLPNRALFDATLDDAIASARRRGRKLAVLSLDLDRFKEINDLLGHAAGDEALRAVGRILSDQFKGARVAARLGGDEFVVLLPDCEQPAAAARAATDLSNTLAAFNAERAVGITVASSIGIAFFPDDAEDRQGLLGAADTALCRAKADGRGIHRFYEAGLGEEVRSRRVIEHDLRGAVARGELKVVYQPQLSTASGAIVGFEALLRWTHRERGAISPAVFIPIAEDTGTILQIGEWVLRTACAEAASWDRPLRIAVNVSAVQIHTAGFAETVEAILAETGIDPRRLELEVTETALVRDMARAMSALNRVKALGVKIAMDDFGTGYSSLSNLRAFPFDRIKIDGSFVQSVDVNSQAAAIVRAILELGRGLDLPILAEGVETQAELGFLGAERCDEVQGFLVGRPAPIEHFAAATQAGPRPAPKAGSLAA